MGAHFLYVPVYLFLFDASMHNQFSYFFQMASTIKEVQIAVFDVNVKYSGSTILSKIETDWQPLEMQILILELDFNAS